MRRASEGESDARACRSLRSANAAQATRRRHVGCATQAMRTTYPAYSARTIRAALPACALACALALVSLCACSLPAQDADPSASTQASSLGGQAASDEAPANANGPAFRNVNLGNDWQPSGSLELEQAEGFTVDYFDGGYKLVCVSDNARYLVIPEGKAAPEGIDPAIGLIQQPIERAYLVATDTFCLIDALGLNDTIALCGTRPEDCAVEGFRTAIEEGSIAYGGKYNAPDYELILQTGSKLAIESTMINHAPEVREQLQTLGLTVLTEQSSYEPTALGRMEWIKLYGALYNEEDRAQAIYDEQMAQVSQAAQEPANQRKTVAFFYINSNGSPVARQPGDYLSQTIELAGGSYILSGLSSDTAKSSITLEMEQFYASAKDADVIIYNSSIDRSVSTIDDLVAKNPLLADFKAVRSGDVWITDQDMYQQMIRTGDIVEEMHRVFSGDAPDNLTYLKKLTE